MSVTTETMEAHVQALLQIPGAKLLFGGKPLTGHSIPEQFGAFEPTAVFVPLAEVGLVHLCARQAFEVRQVPEGLRGGPAWAVKPDKRCSLSNKSGCILPTHGRPQSQSFTRWSRERSSARCKL